MSTMPAEPCPLLLEMRGITKLFPGVRALHNVNLPVPPGAVTALVGENGAGKSTLIKVLGGNFPPDSGEILLEGRPVRFGAPCEARAAGVSVIYQELSLVPEMSVAENIHLAHLPGRAFGWLDRGAMARTAAAALARLGCPLDPWLPVKRLPLAQQQLVEIARSLLGHPRVIVMDEPTAALNDAETARLFAIIAELRSKGRAIVYISHRMDEIFQLADYVAVLRDGENAGYFPRAAAAPDEVIRLMVGREVTDRFPKAAVTRGEALMTVQSLSSPGSVRDISLTLHRGEILGVGGLMGAGQYELARALFGLLPLTAGQVLVDGKEIRLASPRAAMRAGIGLLPEDRKRDALVLPAGVRVNLELAALPRISGLLGWIRRRAEMTLVREQMGRLAIKAASPEQTVKDLSGGNQQKVVLGKWLATLPEIIIMCEPTRGIDVGAKAEIYRLIGQLASAGKGIILISSELPELLALSDEVLVMNEGRVAGTLSRDLATPERVMLLATGGRLDA